MQSSLKMTRINTKIVAIDRHRFEIDGAGVRTLVILYGCPLQCKYCINPKTWNGSGKGKTYSPEQLLDIVSVDSIYFQATNGGITFGGGEPFLHPDFIAEFVDIAPSSWNYVVETSLAVHFENIQKVADKIERFIVDIKSMDEDIYHAYTGGDLALAKENLISLIKLVGQDRITVRVPIIPNYADEKSQENTVKAIQALGITDIDIFTYRI